jgi:hypothetical protein
MEATRMKLMTVLSTTALAVLLGISVPVFAQDDSHPQEDKRAEPDAKAAQQDKQEDKQIDKDKQVDKDKAEKQVDKDKENKQAVQEEKSTAHQDQKQDQRADAKQGGRIPEDRFRANFGRAHTFTIGHPVIVAGTPRFQYGGYWFVIAQPWPVGWAYTDVVYVDFIDGGYYLLSPVHPGVQISINVNL